MASSGRGSKNNPDVRGASTHVCTVKLMRGVSGKTRVVSDTWGTCKRMTGK